MGTKLRRSPRPRTTSQTDRADGAADDPRPLRDEAEEVPLPGHRDTVQVDVPAAQAESRLDPGSGDGSGWPAPVAAGAGCDRLEASSGRGDDPAVVDDGHPVGAVGLGDVVGVQEERHAGVLAQPVQVLPEVAPGLRVEPDRRLVEEEHPRPMKQRPRHLQPPLHAAREGAHDVVAAVSEPDRSSASWTRPRRSRRGTW
jgi:hypothetical protein